MRKKFISKVDMSDSKTQFENIDIRFTEEKPFTANKGFKPLVAIKPRKGLADRRKYEIKLKED